MKPSHFLPRNLPTFNFSDDLDFNPASKVTSTPRRPKLAHLPTPAALPALDLWDMEMAADICEMSDCSEGRPSHYESSSEDASSPVHRQPTPADQPYAGLSFSLLRDDLAVSTSPETSLSTSDSTSSSDPDHHEAPRRQPTPYHLQPASLSLVIDDCLLDMDLPAPLSPVEVADYRDPCDLDSSLSSSLNSTDLEPYMCSDASDLYTSSYYDSICAGFCAEFSQCGDAVTTGAACQDLDFSHLVQLSMSSAISPICTQLWAYSGT